MVASILEYESPVASIRITRARRASSDRILRLRTRRSSSVRSSVVNVSAIWRQRVPVLLQAVQATRGLGGGLGDSMDKSRRGLLGLPFALAMKHPIAQAARQA